MSNYLGSSCPVCEKKFVTGDDVVVCPVCGAPHHRECYAIENHCAFQDEHITGKAWKPVVSPKEASGDFCINPQDGERWQGVEADAKTCQFCGGKNPKDNIFCCFCGNKLLNPPRNTSTQSTAPLLNNVIGIDPAVAIFGGVSPTDNIDEFSAREVATFVGRSSSHYLPQFKAEAESGKRFSVNLSAMFFTFLYFFYRKMYKIGAIFLALFIVVSIPSILYTIEVMPVVFRDSVGISALEELGIDITPHIDAVDQQKAAKYLDMNRYANVINLFVHFVAAILGNKLYYSHSMKKMKEVKDSEQTIHRNIGAIAHETALKKAGGVNIPIIYVCIGVVFLASFALTGYFMVQYMPF